MSRRVKRDREAKKVKKVVKKKREERRETKNDSERERGEKKATSSSPHPPPLVKLLSYHRVVLKTTDVVDVVAAFSVLGDCFCRESSRSCRCC